MDTTGITIKKLSRDDGTEFPCTVLEAIESLEGFYKRASLHEFIEGMGKGCKVELATISFVYRFERA